MNTGIEKAFDIKTIEQQAKAVGFDAFGLAPVTIPERNKQRLADFVAQGSHGTMGWMETRIEQRADPITLWPEVRSIIVLGMNYGPEHDPLERLDQKSRANISVYAENKDYHDLVKRRLKQLGRWLVEKTGCDIKVFVDTAPVLENAIAAQSGVGWQGKHTNVVSREFGSWLFLGEIYTTLDLKASTPEIDHCGSCSSCIDICPTQAITAPYILDAKACISYLTIEHQGSIPEIYRKAMGNRIYGCDDCLAVCPWNKFAKRHDEPHFQTRQALESPQISDFLTFDDTKFRQVFTASPVKRIGIERFLRNVCIAAGNSDDPNFKPSLERLKTNDSSVVVEAATWALGQL